MEGAEWVDVLVDYFVGGVKGEVVFAGVLLLLLLLLVLIHLISLMSLTHLIAFTLFASFLPLSNPKAMSLSRLCLRSMCCAIA